MKTAGPMVIREWNIRRARGFVMTEWPVVAIRHFAKPISWSRVESIMASKFLGSQTVKASVSQLCNSYVFQIYIYIAIVLNPAWLCCPSCVKG